MDSLTRLNFSAYPMHSRGNPLVAEMARIARKYGVTMKEGDPDPDDDDDEEDDDRSSRGRRSQTELMSQLVGMIDKRGGGESGAKAIALKLLDDNEKARDGRRKWKDRATAAEAKIPKEGEVILKKEDAAAFELYKVLGKPDEVKKKMEEGTTAATTLSERDRQSAIAEAATLAQIPNAKLLAKLADPKKENFIVELRDEVREGKNVKVPFARKNEDKAAFMPLMDFAKKELGDYMPALLAKGEGGNGAGSQTVTTTQYPEQTTTGTAPVAGGKVEQFIENRNKGAAARPNPLVPTPAPAAKT
jgi:hypothetical protein